MWKRKSTASKSYELFVEMIGSCQEDFYRFVYMYVKNPDNAMDIVQEATIKGLEKIETLRDSSYMKTWFFRILMNESLNFLKKNQKLVSSGEVEDNVPYQCEESQTVDRITLYEMVDRLPEDMRSVIILRFYEDMKISEVAQTLQLNENTAKARLYKAIRILRRQMERE